MSSKQAATWVAAFALLAVGSYLKLNGPEAVPVPDYPGNATAYAPGGAGTSFRARVERVVDGDTIVVESAGKQEKVRYIGVDTPETVKRNTPVECFGKRASAFNHAAVEGRTVRLVSDREARDRYGRLLAYVFVGDRFVNAELIRRGFARTLEISPNTRYAARFARYENEAIRTNKGLWGACDR